MFCNEMKRKTFTLKDFVYLIIQMQAIYLVTAYQSNKRHLWTRTGGGGHDLYQWEDKSCDLTIKIVNGSIIIIA